MIKYRMTSMAIAVIAALVAISNTYLAPSLDAQIRDKRQLAELIVDEYRSYARDERRAVVRDFRVPGSIDAETTQYVKTHLESVGITPALVGRYEIEGRFKRRGSFGSFELRIINPSGFDHIREYSVPRQWLTDYRDTRPDDRRPDGQPDRGHEDAHGDREHDDGNSHRENEGGPSVGHQIYPNQEWKVFHLPAEIMSHTARGFIVDEEEWHHFWEDTGLPTEAPFVNFEEQMIRIEAVAYPRTINAELFSAGNGKLNVTKNVSHEPPLPGGRLNAHILILSKSDLIQKRKVRLGVTVDATHDDHGVILTSIVEGAPITRGRLDDGNIVMLEPGDIVYSLNGIATDSVGMFADIIKNADGELRAKVRNVQNGDVFNVTFTLN